MNKKFWKRVKFADIDSCWEYQGPISKEGYGTYYSIKDGRNLRYAHRVAYDDLVGSIPPGLWVLHKCDNPKCCNPFHLFLGTSVDNTADRTGKGRDAKGEHNGHSKLTEKQVIQIRQLAANGETERVIAKKFGITYGAVGHIVRRVIWKHI